MKTLGHKKNFLAIENEHSSLPESRIAIVSAPYEHTVSYGGGAAKGPGAILEASAYVEFYDDEFNRELCFDAGIATIRPLEFEKRIDQSALDLIAEEVSALIEMGNLNFASQNAIRQTSTRSSQGDITQNLEDITLQRMTSNFSFSTSWDWASLSASFQRAQNIITDELDVTVPVNFSIPTVTPFAGATGALSFMENLSLGYNGGATGQWVRQDTLPGGEGFRIHDSRFAINHRPSTFT